MRQRLFTLRGRSLIPLTPKEGRVLLFKDFLAIARSHPDFKGLLEEHQKNPPSKRMDKRTRIRILALWLFGHQRPFPRKEINRIIRVVYGRNPPLAQDVPRIAQEVLSSGFCRVRRGYWRVSGMPSPRGRPPKPGAPSATEQAFALLDQRAPEDYRALIRMNFRNHIQGLLSVVQGLVLRYPRVPDPAKEAIIRRLSSTLDALVNATSCMTSAILVGLALDGLISPSEFRRATKRTHSTTLGDFFQDLLRALESEEEKRLRAKARAGYERIYVLMQEHLSN